MSHHEFDLSGRLAIGAWWLLYSGPVQPRAVHAHQAALVVIHAGLPLVTDARGRRLPGPIVVVDPGVGHAYADSRDHVVISFVDPASRIGLRLRDRRALLSRQRQMHPVQEIAGGLRPRSWLEADAVIHRAVASILDGPMLEAGGPHADNLGLAEADSPNATSPTWRSLLVAFEDILAGSTMPEAAHRAGFDDAAHLERACRAMLALSPTEAIELGVWLHR
jgi:AraC-like DNA-binding protein